MKNRYFLMVILLIVACLQFMGCNNNHAEQEVEHPAVVEEIEGSDLTTVTLTERAIERIGLQTTIVTTEDSSPLKLVVPYSSIIYDYSGNAWVYISPEPRTFVRHEIDVDYIQDGSVYLNDGPPEGTVIATVGVAELYGTEFKMGH